MANHDNGSYFSLLLATCAYLEAGYPQAEAEKLAKAQVDRKRNAALQKDFEEEREGLYR